MSKSSVSIPYIVAWILGIIVLALAVYLIYTYIIGSSLDCSQCSAEVTAWCGKCYSICGPVKTNWDGAINNMDEKLKECISGCNLGSISLFEDKCNDYAFDFCRAYIGI